MSLKVYKLAPPNVSRDNIIGCTSGLRPYRKGGIRVQREDIADKVFYHNYGHGGAGVSIGYGTSKILTDQFIKELGHEIKEVAVLGAGYIGIWQALQLADCGYKVTIYAYNFPTRDPTFYGPF